jgi:hypothetical protein
MTTGLSKRATNGWFHTSVIFSASEISFLSKTSAFSQRSYVANTLRIVAGRAPLPFWSNLAEDITGWPCKAVEFFERLAMTQHCEPRTPRESRDDSMSASAYEMQSIGSPFETASRTVDVRHIDNSPRADITFLILASFSGALSSYLLKDTRASKESMPSATPSARSATEAILFNRVCRPRMI